MSVIVVSTGVPALPDGLNPAVAVRPLADPNHSLRAAVPALTADRNSAVVLVARDGTLLRSVPSVKSVADFRGDLGRLW